MTRVLTTTNYRELIMTMTDSTTNDLRQVDSQRITTHKAAINPLIRDYQLGDTINQLSAVLAFTQVITLLSNDGEGIHLPSDAVTGLYYVLQIAMDTVDYIGKCDLTSANKSTFISK